MRLSTMLAAASALALATATLPAAAADQAPHGTPAPVLREAPTVPNMDQPGPPGAGPENAQQERTEHERTTVIQRRSVTEESGVMPQEGGPDFPTDIVGHNLLNTHGDVVGEITAVRGNRILVSVGSYLGLGRHEIELNHDEVNISKGGQITTPLTITRLQQKPAVSVQSTQPKTQSNDRFEPR